MTNDDQTAQFLGSRMEATICIHTVAEGQELCTREKVLPIRDIEARLHGPFEVISISMDTMLTDFRHHLNTFERQVHGL
jgi:hypothetical protein